MLKRFRTSLGYLILLLTVVAFVTYGSTHKQLWQTLFKLNIFYILLILFLYFVVLGVMILLLEYTVEICGSKMDVKENARISAYSQLINFFGPLQSGPGFRAFYLKKKFKISFGSFLGATIIYYLIYAALSGIMALAPSSYWPWLFLLIPLGLAAIYSVYKLFLKYRTKKSNEADKLSLSVSIIMKLALATLIQVIMLFIIYFTELRIVSHAISLRQAFIYTGVANLTLFVALTPGGIGIREAFLLFSNKLHHIPNKTVIAASVIDRTVFLVFLAILFIIVASLHIKNKLGYKETAKTET